MEKDLNILMVEPEPSFLAAIDNRLNGLGFNYRAAATPEATIDELEALSPDLAIMGPSLGIKTCLRCVQKLRIIDFSIPIIACVEDRRLTGGIGSAAFDGVHALKPTLDPDEILWTIEHALQYKEKTRIPSDFPILIGQSEGITAVREKIKLVADKDITVLVTGESGTGKELIARSIHCLSIRNQGPLVKITCGALPDELLESEVFGFQKGAFTGALRNKPGRIEMASGGTLFIDEIGDLSLHLQVKFLQVLEDKAFSRLGDTQDKIVDARVVAATNVDLAKKVHEGTFRQDLYYRLNVVHIVAPPLRERKDDIMLITHYFLDKYCFEFKREPMAVPQEVVRLFEGYHWPGNVRELENVIRRAIVLRNWKMIYKELMLENGLQENERLDRPGDGSLLTVWGDDEVRGFFREADFSLKKISKSYVSEVEKQAIMNALRETNWNRKKAAQMLKVSYKTLLNRIDEFALRP
jgi:two-component system response regulator AtoC